MCGVVCWFMLKQALPLPLNYLSFFDHRKVCCLVFHQKKTNWKPHRLLFSIIKRPKSNHVDIIVWSDPTPYDIDTRLSLANYVDIQSTWLSISFSQPAHWMSYITLWTHFPAFFWLSVLHSWTEKIINQIIQILQNEGKLTYWYNFR